MSNKEQKYFNIIAIIIVMLSIKLYIDHRKDDYKGPYRPYGMYKNITNVKHDVTKIFFTSIFPILIYGVASNQSFIDFKSFNSFIHSSIGKAIVYSMGFFVFNEFIQPYIINRLI